MFRDLVRKKQQLSDEDCIAILKTEKRGVLSVMGDDGYPYGMPMNHWYDEHDGSLWFHSGLYGHRTDAVKQHNKVSFCVYDQGVRQDGEWALNIKSVIVFGKITLVDDRDTIRKVSADLSRKFTQDEKYIAAEIEAYAHKTLLLHLIPEHICGKLVTES